MEKTIYELQIHEKVNKGDFSVYRVPGGWIYVFIDESPCSMVFVPWHNEFQLDNTNPTPLKITTNI